MKSIKTKHFTCSHFLTSNYGWKDLDDAINDFLHSESVEYIDIKYSSISTSINHISSETNIKSYSALLIYKEL